MAINITDISTTGTSIEIDVSTIILQAVITVAVSVGGGTLLGYYMSERSRTKQEKNEIKKIKELLKDDFERLNTTTIVIIKDIVSFADKLSSDAFIENFLGSVTNASAYIIKYFKYYDFNYWFVPIFEFVLGIILLLGYYSRIGALMILPIMVVAISVHLTVSNPAAFPSQPQEPYVPIVIILMAFIVMSKGGGNWSMDLKSST